jgi:hypothetical protein
MQQAQAMQSASQPFIKLIQSNMDLMNNFATSPEVTSQAMNDAQDLFKQAQESTLKLMQSHAFTRLMHGLLKNVTDFYGDFGRSASSAMQQGQESLMHQAEEATSNIVDATQAGVRRARQAS